MEYILYACIGAGAGFFAGLLGIGGGIIINPLLILVFNSFLDFDAVYATHMAIGTTLATIALIAPMSAATHIRNGGINFHLATLLSIGGAAGVGGGVLLAVYLPAAVLKILLAVFLLYTARNMLFPRSSAYATEIGKPLPPGKLVSVGGGVGFLSAIIAIAGGALIVPYLNRRGVPIKTAIGTAALVGFPLALIAALGYIASGVQNPLLPENTWGYVYPPALFSLAATGIIAAHLGARMTAQFSPLRLRRIFGVLTLILALRLLWSTII